MKSKKQSAASYKSKPHSSLVLFLDRSLGKHVVATALRQAGAHVEIHDDHFASDARDEDWLKDVGRRGWAVLTKDRRIRYRAPELAALRKARVRTFVLTAGDLQGTEMATIFTKALPAINRFAARNPPPFIATITKAGSVSMLYKELRPSRKLRD